MIISCFANRAAWKSLLSRVINSGNSLNRVHVNRQRRCLFDERAILLRVTVIPGTRGSGGV